MLQVDCDFCLCVCAVCKTLDFKVELRSEEIVVWLRLICVV